MCWCKRYPTKQIQIENNFLASASVDVQNVNVNDQVLITDVRLDAGWAAPGATLTYTGEPDRVRINVNVIHGIAAGTNIQRANPVIVLRRNGNEIARSSTGYIRDLDVHENSSNTIGFVDHVPGINPAYDLVSEQEGAAGVVTSAPQSSFSAEAVEINACEVLFVDSGSDEGDGGDGENPFTPNDDLTVTFFNEQQFNFAFGLQNATSQIVSDWSVQIANATYQIDETQLTNSTAFDLVTTNNPGGTFTHTFIGAVDIPAFAGLPGGNIAWNGVDFGVIPTSDGIETGTGGG